MTKLLLYPAMIAGKILSWLLREISDELVFTAEYCRKYAWIFTPLFVIFFYSAISILFALASLFLFLESSYAITTAIWGWIILTIAFISYKDELGVQLRRFSKLLTSWLF